MNTALDPLIRELSTLIADLGKGGGQMGASVYDTAQALRLLPPQDDVRPIRDWLLSQQQADGGWGEPRAPLTRAVPTLAAVLALHAYPCGRQTREAVQAGLSFLRTQSGHWTDPLPDDLPVAVELLLPRLLDEAAALGLALPQQPYAGLIVLGHQRRRTIARQSLRAGMPVVYSWEGWGTVPDPALLDSFGGIGLSPAATAAWLRAASEHAGLEAAVQSIHCQAAWCYLARASASTEVGISGVMPLAWPITRFEQAFGLYALLMAGLLDHPALAAVVRPQLDDLFRALKPEGLGFCDGFSLDGDDTAVAIAVLRAAGYPVNLTPLQHFATDDHFCTWPGELQPALSVTAHAVHAQALCGTTSLAPQTYLLGHQGPDGRWLGDKWNTSWLYTTSQAVQALYRAGTDQGLPAALNALVTAQHADGGWGTGSSTLEETAYAVFALQAASQAAGDLAARRRAFRALQRAQQWLLAHGHTTGTTMCWLGKALYRPPRIARVIELAAIVKGLLDEPIVA
jgi:hypothetical protein